MRNKTKHDNDQHFNRQFPKKAFHCINVVKTSKHETKTTVQTQSDYAQNLKGEGAEKTKSWLNAFFGVNMNFHGNDIGEKFKPDCNKLNLTILITSHSLP